MKADVLATLVVLALITLVSFLGIISEINKKFGAETPAFGGTLREGIIGNPRFINPLLAQSDADRDMSSLVYTGLFRYGLSGNLEPALAGKYEISEEGLVYTVTLKEDLYWEDGSPLTADDVAFTVELAKNPLAGSPQRPSWEGVDMERVDEKTVRFYLKRAYAPFLENLTLGILPKHLWEQIPPSQISFAAFNLKPVGAGPFKIKSVSKDSLGSVASIKLTANKYFAAGKPHIKNLILRFYPDEERMLKDLERGLLDSAGGVSAKNVEELKKRGMRIREIGLQRIIAVFLNQGAQKAFASPEIRRAMNLALDKNKLVEKVLSGYGGVIDGPLPEKPARETTYDPDLAKEIVSKQKNEVAFTLTTVKTAELVELAALLEEMWENAGFKVETKTFPVGDLESGIIGPRRYEAFLYGEEVIGRVPDPFAFWHSSQRAHPGFNIALYANSKVDKILEEVRTTLDDEKRAGLYNDIQREIKKDLPAIFLFSPSYVYAMPENLGGAEIEQINTGSERFAAVHQWYLKRKYVWKIFLN